MKHWLLVMKGLLTSADNCWRISAERTLVQEKKHRSAVAGMVSRLSRVKARICSGVRAAMSTSLDSPMPQMEAMWTPKVSMVCRTGVNMATDLAPSRWILWRTAPRTVMAALCRYSVPNI